MAVKRRRAAKLGPSFRGAAFVPQHQLVDALKDMGLLPPGWRPKPKEGRRPDGPAQEADRR